MIISARNDKGIAGYGRKKMIQEVNMKKNTAIILRCLLVLQGLFWLVMSALGLLKPDAKNEQVFIAILMIANGAAFIVLALTVNKDMLLLRIFSMAFLFVNLILTVTDQMGTLDYCTLALNIVTLAGYIYLYAYKERYPAES